MQSLLLNFSAEISTALEIFASTSCCYLQDLEMCDSNSVDDIICSLFATHCTCLTSFNIKSSYISDTSFQELVKKNHELRCVNISETRICDVSSLQSLSEKCVFLQILDISFCDFSDLSIYQLATCANLTTLKMWFCTSLTLQTTQHIVLSCPLLTDLNIGGCGNVLVDSFLIYLSRHARSIKHLNLQRLASNRRDPAILNGQISDLGVEALCHGCCKIETLIISANRGISLYSIVECIALFLTRLKTIEFRFMNFIDHNKVFCALGMTFEHFEVFDPVFGTLSGFPRVRERNAPWFRDMLISKLSGMTDLNPVELRLSKLNRVGEDTVDFLLSDKLNVGEVTLVNSHRIKVGQFSGAYINLTKLHLRGFSISDDSLRVFGIYCSTLTEITLVRCTSITDIGITHLINSNRAIENFLCFSCEQVTDASVMHLIQVCFSSLKHFRMTECDTVISTIDRLLSKCTKLTTLQFTHNDISPFESRSRPLQPTVFTSDFRIYRSRRHPKSSIG
jgi:hypothetical protein